jgi:hypothetical protein
VSATVFSTLGQVGFVSSLVTGIFAPSLRSIVWPVQTPTGAPQPQSATNNTPATQSLTGYVPILEEHRDEMTITEHPVEQGAAVTDHAYKLPALLTLRLGWSTSQPANNPFSLGNLTGVPQLNGLSLPTLSGFWSTASDVAINNIYQTLLGLQINRTLLTVTTARRAYTSLLLQSLSLTTDDKTEHALVVTAVLKEVILVSAQVISNPVNSNANANPGAYNPTQSQGQQQLQPSNVSIPNATTPAAGGLT